MRTAPVHLRTENYAKAVCGTWVEKPLKLQTKIILKVPLYLEYTSLYANRPKDSAVRDRAPSWVHIDFPRELECNEWFLSSGVRPFVRKCL